MTRKFTASIIREGAWYVATCVELGVTSQGRTIRSAKKNLKEAIELYLENEPSLKRRVWSKPLFMPLNVEYEKTTPVRA